MGLIRVGDSGFFHCPTLAMLINSPFTFHYQAQTSPSLSILTVTSTADPSSMQDACHI